MLPTKELSNSGTRTIDYAIYLLISTFFLPNFITQYIGLIYLIIYFFLRPKVSFKKNFALYIPALLLLWSILSWLVNLYKGNCDKYSILFWIIGYFPCFLLFAILFSLQQSLDFKRYYRFYKKLVYFQSILLIASAIQYRTYVVGDPATGTVGDANWVAFHICFVIIIESIKLVIKQHSKYTIWELIYLGIVLMIPESTANVGFLFITISLILFNEFLIKRLNPAKIIVGIILVFLSFLSIVNTALFERFTYTYSFFSSSGITEHPALLKFNVYRKLFNGTLYDESSYIFGNGPGSFTSRCSVIRMPEERVNDFPLQLPYFKSPLFKTHIAPYYQQWRDSDESHGNFASPQTSFISIGAELGIVGLLLFGYFFYKILKLNNLSKTTTDPESEFKRRVVSYLTFFYTINLFHLNFWEYGVVSFPYFIFVVCCLPVVKCRKYFPSSQPI